VLIFLTNFVVFSSRIITPRYTTFNRSTEAFLESAESQIQKIIQLEALAVISTARRDDLFFGKSPSFTIRVMFGFGFGLVRTWQYAHHYGTVRDVQKGAMKFEDLEFLDRIWLNHNWHLNHHMVQRCLGCTCNSFRAERDARRLVKAYLREWRGPNFSDEHWRIAMQESH